MLDAAVDRPVFPLVLPAESKDVAYLADVGRAQQVRRLVGDIGNAARRRSAHRHAVHAGVDAAVRIRLVVRDFIVVEVEAPGALLADVRVDRTRGEPQIVALRVVVGGTAGIPGVAIVQLKARYAEQTLVLQPGVAAQHRRVLALPAQADTDLVVVDGRRGDGRLLHFEVVGKCAQRQHGEAGGREGGEGTQVFHGPLLPLA